MDQLPAYVYVLIGAGYFGIIAVIWCLFAINKKNDDDDGPSISAPRKFA